MHSLDNYNRFQPFSLQRVGRSGIFRNGIVYNMALQKEFNMLIGILLLNRINGGPTRKQAVQFVLGTLQFAADVQGMHHTVGRDDLLPISSCISPQRNAAIKNHFIISPHCPVRARKTPWENGKMVSSPEQYW
jgi:hypothetical protein